MWYQLKANTKEKIRRVLFGGARQRRTGSAGAVARKFSEELLWIQRLFSRSALIAGDGARAPSERDTAAAPILGKAF